MKTTRRAASNARFVVSASGLAAPKRAEVKAGHGYYIGASSSPSYVLVLSVTDERITYANAYSLDVRTEQRWIAEDLIATAGATVEKQAAASEASGCQFAKHARARATAHGAPVELSAYDRQEVTLEARGDGDHYGAAQSYGCLVGGDGVTGFVVAGSREALAGVETDARFAVVGVRMLKVCPTA